MQKIYHQILDFQKKYPLTIGWRLNKHAKVLDLHINPDERALYAFYGQKNDVWYDVFSTCVVCLTSKRILIGQKKLLWGYKYISITPHMFNDLNLRARLFWGISIIDTIQEQVKITNIDKRALGEIETKISSYMLKEKQKYLNPGKEEIN